MSLEKQKYFGILRLSLYFDSNFAFCPLIQQYENFNYFAYYYYYIIITITMIIIIIIIIIIISFMQGIYTYIPETNHVPRE